MKGPNWNRLLRLAMVACLSMSAAVADQIVLKDGDRLTGSIIKKEEKTITIKTLHFGIVTTDWDQVASITADKPIHVVLQDGRALEGTLSAQGGELELKTAGSTVTVPPAQIAVLRDADEQRAYERLLRPGLFDLWSGSVNFGFAGAIGNARTSTLTGSFDAARITRTDKTSVYFKTIKATALVDGRSAETAQA